MTPATLPFHRVGDGPPVLVLHGLGGDHRQSLDLAPPGLPRSWIAPDLPGHGESGPAEGPVGFGPFAALVAELLDTTVDGPVPVVGVSMGAGIAVTLAASRPDLVDRLVLIRPAWLDRPPPHLAVFTTIAELLGSLSPQDGAAAFQNSAEYAHVQRISPVMAASLLGQFDRADAVERRRVLAEMPRSVPLLDQDAYRRLVVASTLVVAAPDDPVHPESLARTLAEWIPHARLTLVPAKGLDATEHLSAVRDAVALGLR